MLGHVAQSVGGALPGGIGFPDLELLDWFFTTGFTSGPGEYRLPSRTIFAELAVIGGGEGGRRNPTLGGRGAASALYHYNTQAGGFILPYVVGRGGAFNTPHDANQQSSVNIPDLGLLFANGPGAALAGGGPAGTVVSLGGEGGDGQGFVPGRVTRSGTLNGGAGGGPYGGPGGWSIVDSQNNNTRTLSQCFRGGGADSQTTQAGGVGFVSIKCYGRVS